MINLDITYQRLLKGNPTISQSEKQYMNTIVGIILKKGSIDQCELKDVNTIIKISNVLYNNAPNIILPLEDSDYDRLLVLCRRQGIAYPVGAPPVKFQNLESFHRLEAHDDGPKEVVTFVKNKDDMIFFKPLTSNQTYPEYGDYSVNTDAPLIGRKTRSVSHNYDMCGTLEKCKYTLNKDAQAEGVFNDPSVQIFERDFLGKHIQMGLVDPNNIHLIASLKYDGISVEASVDGDHIVDACTRGDTANNEASDLTPALAGLQFPRAYRLDPDGTPFGLKFEFIATNNNLARLVPYGKTYVNPRNAVIGLLGGLDARQFRDFLTPVPLESTLNIPRADELRFLNKYFTHGIDMRWTEIQGDYVKALYEVKRFVEEADSLRSFMGFQYDGVVIEYADEFLRRKLGKRNSIPNYSIAIKFPPLKRKSTFTHYTFSVGQTGVIIPMAHFKPVEFFGAIHDKTTVHSYKRFKNLALRSGDKVNLSLNNDVIVYLTKAPEEEQPDNHNPYEEFPTVCPSCGHDLFTSDSGDSVYCLNFQCPERIIARLANMLKKLNIKDFSTASIRMLEIKSLYELLTYPLPKMTEVLGETDGPKLYKRLETLKQTVYPDYRLMGSIGFSGLGAESWRTILEQFPLEKVIYGSDKDLEYIGNIRGMGPKTVDVIKIERPLLMDDLKVVFHNLHHKDSYQADGVSPRVPIRFSGVRDKALMQMFNEKGFDANDEGAVSKRTGMLIVPYKGFMSGKVKTAFHILTEKVMQRDPDNTAAIGYETMDLAKGMTPWVMTLDEAYAFIKNYSKN